MSAEWIIAAAESGRDLIFTNTRTGNVYKVGALPGPNNGPGTGDPGYGWAIGVPLLLFCLYLLYDYFFGREK